MPPTDEQVIIASNALCRGERDLMEESLRSQLVCYHLDVAKLRPEAAFLRLTHVRIEEAYKSPNIVVVRDFLTDRECDTLRQYSGE